MVTGRGRKALIVALAIVALALGLAACGGDDGGEAAPPAEPAPAEPAPAEPPAEPAPAEPPAEEPAPAEPPAEEPAPAVESIKIALDFTPNTNHSGIYIALANGYFDEQGIAAEVIPYAFGTPPTSLLASGAADLAVGFPPDVAIQVAGGADLKIVAEIIQVNNAALVTLADSPLTGPADFSGKKYGGYGTPHEAPVVSAILSGAGVEPVFEEVILSTGAIEALTSGDVDFSAVYEGWSEIGAELAGSPLKTFPYKDYVDGYIFPDVVFVTSGELIASKADALRRALVALEQGYTFAAENPAEAAEILTAQVPELGQSQELVNRSADFRAPQYLDESGKWGCLREEQFTGAVDLLTNAGVIAESPAFADYATNELLEGC
jgi:ABC-type nitrate/sulfonate/bicarbonate transport system substrate-binding protein